MKRILYYFLFLTVTTMSAPVLSDVVLINNFSVEKGREQQAIEAWEAARDFLSKQPGYISTKLHKSLSSDATYQLINVAEWESPALFKQAIGRMMKAKVFPKVEGLQNDPALYTVIRGG